MAASAAERGRRAGAGKSTLLKLMVGDLMATEGEVKRHSHLSIARYHQHSVDQLDNSSMVLEFFQVAAAATASPHRAPDQEKEVVPFQRRPPANCADVQARNYWTEREAGNPTCCGYGL